MSARLGHLLNALWYLHVEHYAIVQKTKADVYVSTRNDGKMVSEESSQILIYKY